LKLFFGDRTSTEILLDHVRSRREEAERLRERLLALDELHAGAEEDRFRAITRRYGLEHAQAIVRWADAVERELS
jgi:hypothetical protein